MCVLVSVFMCVPAWRGTNLHSGSHWYVPHHCLLDLLSLAHRVRERRVAGVERQRSEDAREYMEMGRKKKKKIADCGDLANLSAQTKQYVSLWSNRIWLLLSPSRLTNTRAHTQSLKTQLVLKTGTTCTLNTHTHFPKRCCQGSSTEPDRRTCAHTPDDSTNTCCRHNIHLANAPERWQSVQKTRLWVEWEQQWITV